MLSLSCYTEHHLIDIVFSLVELLHLQQAAATAKVLCVYGVSRSNVFSVHSKYCSVWKLQFALIHSFVLCLNDLSSLSF